MAEKYISAEVRMVHCWKGILPRRYRKVMQASAVTIAGQSDVVLYCSFTPSGAERTNHDLERYLHVDEGLELASKEDYHDVL